MEKMKNIAIENKNNLLLLFLGGAILAGINTFLAELIIIYSYIYICHIFGNLCQAH